MYRQFFLTSWSQVAIKSHRERNSNVSVRSELVEGRKSIYLHYFIVCLLCFLSSPLFAVDVYQLPNPEQQKAYETLTQELRCLVCQNQNIADSNAELAGDLRRQVYEMLQQGKSKDDIIQFMTDRYGDFVMYNPPFKAKTGLLWLGPVVFLMTGFVMLVIFLRRKKKVEMVAFDKSKQEKIRRLLSENTENGEQS